MAAGPITVSQSKDQIFQNGYVTRMTKEYGQSSGDAGTDTLTSTLVRPKRLKAIFVEYDDSPTYTTDVTVDLDSGLGTDYDITGLITINTASDIQSCRFLPGVQTALHTGYVPLGNIDFVFGADDQLVVQVPDGGGAIKATATIVWEEMR